MSRENALGQCAGLKQSEAQQHRVPENAPDGSDDIIRNRHTLDQHRIDADADHNEESLKTKGKQGPEIILSHHTLLAVSEGGKRNRCQAGHQVNLNHASVDDDEDHNAQGLDGKLNHHAMQEQREERSDFHGLQRILHGSQCGCIHRRISRNQSACVIDHMLRHVKDGHHDVEGVGDKNYGNKGLEDPFEEDPGFKIGKVVVVDDHLNQLVAGDEG